jgi:hypothetical protein
METPLKQSITKDPTKELFKILKAPGGVSISNGDINVIERLITVDKADVNARDSNNWTPLLYVAAGSSSSWREYESQALGKLLIENKADVNAKWTYGQTPLMFTVRNLGLCKSLVENKGNLYMKSVKDTPLIYAARYANRCLDLHNYSLMKYYVTRMMKPDTSLAILFLGVKRFRRSPSLLYLDINIIIKIVKHIKLARKRDLHVQIMSIEDIRTRDLLLSEIASTLLPNIKIK